MKRLALTVAALLSLAGCGSDLDIQEPALELDNQDLYLGADTNSQED